MLSIIHSPGSFFQITCHTRGFQMHFFYLQGQQKLYYQPKEVMQITPYRSHWKCNLICTAEDWKDTASFLKNVFQSPHSCTAFSVIKICIHKECNIKVNKHSESSCLFYTSVKKTSTWSEIALTPTLKPFCINNMVVSEPYSKLEWSFIYNNTSKARSTFLALALHVLVRQCQTCLNDWRRHIWNMWSQFSALQYDTTVLKKGSHLFHNLRTFSLKA